MRLLSNLLFGLAALIAGLAVLLYLYAGGMACAFSTSSTCGIKPPWRLGAEDLLYLVVLPAAVVAGLVGAAVMARRRRTRPSARPGRRPEGADEGVA